MKVFLTLILLSLSGCYSNQECKEGKVWNNLHPFALENIYIETNQPCKQL